MLPLHTLLSVFDFVPQILTKTIGIRGFSYSCPSIWNSLPAHLNDNQFLKNSFWKTVENIFV